VCSTLQIDKRKTNCPKWIKIVKRQQHIVKIFYMWMLCITLKEKNTKRFVQNWHSPVSFDRMVMIFFHRTCNVFFICYAVILLQYSKSVWSKLGTLIVYMLISCILMPDNCFRSGQSCKMYAIFTMFSSSEVSFEHF
jgi:hypothetical protein